MMLLECDDLGGCKEIWVGGFQVNSQIAVKHDKT